MTTQRKLAGNKEKEIYKMLARILKLRLQTRPSGDQENNISSKIYLKDLQRHFKVPLVSQQYSNKVGSKLVKETNQKNSSWDLLQTFSSVYRS